MLTKFESKSNRVKGLSFHPTRPWILASLHNGVIQLWDIRMGTLLDRFEEHDGPVRGVDFHSKQPIFVSGGDDYKIKIWNWKLRRCLFTLLGHLDYIRTVEFHKEYPWLVSASDDQTIRLWNWQSRTCISVLTGHNHYVMCASFHPEEDLVVSASLDQTVRVWDVSGLRKKTVRGVPGEDASSGGPPGLNSVLPGGLGAAAGGAGGRNNAVMSRVNADLFGGTEAVVKYVLEGHDRGVNWASFHHSLPLIVSGADDRQVKLWRMNETKAWEVDTLRGHTNNVSCAIFHPRAELIISNSEDRSIRVWDVTKRVALQTFRREHDRFWIMAAHQEQNLLAAGHDSGMIVFKLERERPAFQTGISEQQLYYVKDRYLRLFAYSSSRDVPLVSLKKVAGASSGSNSGASPLGSAPRLLYTNPYNPSETNVLIFSDIPNVGGSYELAVISKETANQSDSQETLSGQGMAAAFIARNRFAVLEDKTKQILIKNLSNQVTKRFESPNPNVDGMFPGGTAGRVILRCEDRVMLFETQSRKILSEVMAPRVKYVIWSYDSAFVVLLSKHQITICNRQLEQLSTVNETVRVKSAAWGQHGLLIYTTLTHIKYCLPNGDSGVIRTLDVPVYATKVQNDTLHCLDRECKVRTIEMDTTECKFKIALMRKQYRQVLHMIRNSNLCGQAIITYLQKKGFPEVALHFVEDKKARFNLALECGNLDVARECAAELKDIGSWHRLGVEALRQGYHQVAELAFQKTSDFSRLSFLYLVTGNTQNLRRMLMIAERRKDIMSRFHNALLLGDVKERIKILEEVGQYSLAYLASKVHGFEDDANRFAELLTEAEAPLPSIPDPSETRLLVPPTPIVREGNWPLVEVNRGIIHDALQGDFAALDRAEAEEAAREAEARARDVMSANSAWQDEDDGTPSLSSSTAASSGAAGAKASSALAAAAAVSDMDDGGGWGDTDELDLGDIAPAATTQASASSGKAEEADSSSSGIFVAPSVGVSKPTYWSQGSTLAADHVAAGAYEQAMRLLNRQIGIVNFAPLKPIFQDIHMASRCYVPGLPSISANESYLQRNDAEGDPGKNSLPFTCIRLSLLVSQLQEAYINFQKGKFPEAMLSFQAILQAIPLIVVSRGEVVEVKELLAICREYVTGIRLELARKEATEVKNDANRAVELSAYFTHCALQPAHVLLALKPAMVRAFKLENFIHAASLARRILEMPDIQSEKNLKTKQDALKVLAESEKQARNAQKIDYDDSKPFNMCAVSMKPIYSGTRSIKCPFCGSHADPQFSGKVCPTCNLSELGLETLGLVCSMDDRR